METVARFLERYDIHSYTAALITAEESETGPHRRLGVQWIAHVDPDWFAYYQTEDLAQADYGLRKHAIERDPAMLKVGQAYSDLYDDMSAAETRMFDEQAEVGIVSGLTVPRWSRIGKEEVASGFALWSSEDAEGFDRLLENHGAGIVAFLLSVEQQLTPMIYGEAQGWSALTARERECLTLTAMGSRVADIAHRLALAEVTVSVHLRTARQKLGARTLPEAVAKALTAGLIRP
ncbi:helix-turn-helix transcriptional regulator [Parvularcula lutaonensis]|uniref:LuxR C-terminal-related transcriptional regulator n=1 Tax=Parvularcula lutaonensis TaxID=491923 RepID=A0ABV7M758_9PROT|nr:hypothetical protein GCM10007148_07250 [Parvularcula lutaonensis]